jgi:hypothetical protein
LAASVGNHLIDVHVELRAATGHPDVQREHLVMLSGQNLVAGPYDQPVRRVVEPATCAVGVGRRLLQHCVGGDHLPRYQVLTDAEMLKRTLGLRSPKLVSRHLDHAQAVGFSSKFGHGIAPFKCDAHQA